MFQAKAVCFDLFETLISEYADGVRKAERRHGHDAARLGLDRDVYRREWGALHERRMTGAIASYAEALRRILAGQGAPCDEQALQELYERRVAEKKAAFRGIDPDVFALLERLKRAGAKLALISNCTEEEVQGWADSGLAPYFDEVLFSYRVGLAKPDAAIYRLACERLGAAEAQCAFIGDGGSDELNGASRAGMRAYRAVWYLPLSMRERTDGFPTLATPMDALAAVGYAAN